MPNKIIIHYNNLTSSDFDYNKRIEEITNHYVWAPDGFEVIETTNITETLEYLSSKVDESNKWVWVNTFGHGISGTSVSEFYDKSVAKCEQAGSPLMAHVMQDSSNDWYKYPSFHEQCFIINLLEWRQVGCPSFEIVSDTNVTLNELNRSKENFHDEYTPHWVGPDTTGNVLNVNYRMFGSQVIEKFTGAGHKVINFDEELRKQKWHLYPNDNYAELSEFFTTGKIDIESNLYKSIIHIAFYEKNSLEDTIYILNTEPIGDCKTVEMPVDYYIVVAGGFKPALLSYRYGITANTKVICVDISDAGIDYQKFMREFWNGDLDQYPSQINDFKSKHPNYRLAWRDWNTMESEINSFLIELGITKQQFKEAWEQYCKLDIEYWKLDLLNDNQRIIDFVLSRSGKNFYIWFSNAFDMQWSVFMLGKTYTQDKLYSMLEQFKQSNNNITIEHSTQHTSYNSQE